jgi:hypothetical protein
MKSYCGKTYGQKTILKRLSSKALQKNPQTEDFIRKSQAGQKKIIIFAGALD